ncbi:MAG: PASTA domain-containing protein, partial [Actinomycetota bacterium]
LIGMSKLDAQNALSAKGLIASISELTNPDPTTWGKVYDQDPTAGTKVDEGATVIVYVGKLYEAPDASGALRASVLPACGKNKTGRFSSVPPGGIPPALSVRITPTWPCLAGNRSFSHALH